MFAVDDSLGTATIPIVFLTTVVGVILGASYRTLLAYQRAGNGKIESFSGLFSDIFRSVDLWLGLVAGRR